MRETEISIKTPEGNSLAATYCEPNESGGPFPAVMMCQGLSGLRNLVLPPIAHALAKAGIASVRFDYAGFGESTGESGWIDPLARIRDARIVLAWLGGQSSVNENCLGIYGHSYGGSVALVTASQERAVKAIAAVSPTGDGEGLLEDAWTAWDWHDLKQRVAKERSAIAGGAEPTRVPTSDIFPLSPAFQKAYQELKERQAGEGGVPKSAADNRTFYLMSVDRMVEFRPSDWAPRTAHLATLFVSGADDDTAPIEGTELVFAAITGTKKWVLVPGAHHNTLDLDPGLSEAVSHVVPWFTDHLVDYSVPVATS